MSVALENRNAAAQLFPGRNFLYPHEVCRVLRITRSHMLSLIEERVIPAVRINGAGNSSDRSNYRIAIDDLDRFLEQGGTPIPNGRSK